MIKLKRQSTVRFLIIFALLPCILLGALQEFHRNIQEIVLRSSALSRGASSESTGAVLLVSESGLLCGQPLTPSKAKLNKLLRQFLPLIALVPLLKAFSKVTIGNYWLHHYPLVFFHILLISLLLGGRAPPRSLRPPPGCGFTS